MFIFYYFFNQNYLYIIKYYILYFVFVFIFAFIFEISLPRATTISGGNNLHGTSGGNSLVGVSSQSSYAGNTLGPTPISASGPGPGSTSMLLPPVVAASQGNSTGIYNSTVSLSSTNQTPMLPITIMSSTAPQLIPSLQYLPVSSKPPPSWPPPPSSSALSSKYVYYLL